MEVLKKPIFWVVLLILASLVLSIFIFTPSFFKNVPNVNNIKNNVKKDIIKNKLGSCQILEQQFCNQYEVIEWKFEGSEYKLIAFSLPPGTPIYSPRKGQLLKAEYEEGGPFVGSLGAVIDPAGDDPRALSFIGDLGFNNNLTEDINAGAMIATIQDTGVKNFGKFNFIFMAAGVNESGKGDTDIELLDQLFKNL